MTTNTESATTDGLLPCPFCGSAPEFHKDKMLEDAWLGCMNRTCSVAPYVETTELAERGCEASAIEAWNRRADTLLAASRAEVEMLRAALKACAAVCSGETMDKNGLINALELARAALSTNPTKG